jgi:hypothetical protein
MLSSFLSREAGREWVKIPSGLQKKLRNDLAKEG